MSSLEVIHEAFDDFTAAEAARLDAEEAVLATSYGHPDVQPVRYVRWKKQLLQTDPGSYLDREALIGALPGLDREQMERLNEINSGFEG